MRMETGRESMKAVTEKQKLRNFRTIFPFLQEIPDDIYFQLSTNELHFPSPELRVLISELEEKIGHYVMPYEANKFDRSIYPKRHFCGILKGALLSEEQQILLRKYESKTKSYGVTVVIYQKPVELTNIKRSKIYMYYADRNLNKSKDGKARLKKFLNSHQLAVIATLDPKNPTPESALIAFVEDDNLCLYFQTGKYTRKAQNLSKNPYVSFVIGHTLDELATMQYEGRCEQLQSKDLINDCKQRFLSKNSPTTLEYLERPDAILFKATPVWIRLVIDKNASEYD